MASETVLEAIDRARNASLLRFASISLCSSILGRTPALADAICRLLSKTVDGQLDTSSNEPLARAS